MPAKVFRKLATFCGVARSHDSVSYRRILATKSLTRGPSLNGVSPLPSPSVDRGHSCSKEDLESALDMLGSLIDETDKPDVESRFQDVKIFLQSNIPHLGQVLDKFGGAANGQVPMIAGRTTSSDSYREISLILKGLGQLHWVGAGLVIAAVALDRYSKVTKYSEELSTCMSNLRSLAKHVLRMRGLVQDLRSSESLETVHKAVQIIIEHAAFCKQATKKRHLFTRCLFADRDHLKLVDLDNQRNKLYPELGLTAVCDVLEAMHSEPTGETFEPSEDTVMVGNVKRVDEALKTLKDHETTKRVRALILWGTPGAGKSTVGQQVAAHLKKEKNIDKLNCCKIAMRGEEGEEIKVADKQEELYRKLRGGVKKFSGSQEGRREIDQLFGNLISEPVLLLFDNVHSVRDLENLLPCNLSNCLHPQSILLLTTGNHGVINVLERKGVSCLCYEVKELEEKEANELLLMKIFGDCDVSHDSQLAKELRQSKDVQDLLNICSGVPLAISFVGSYVWSRRQKVKGSGKNPSMEAVYAELNSTSQREFFRKLITSVRHAYNCLRDGDTYIDGETNALHRSLDFAFNNVSATTRIRDAFLDIVAVHLGCPWKDAELMYGDDLTKLKQLSMVKRLVYRDGSSHAIVQVHNLLIGRSRKMENMECPERRVVVDKVDELPKCFRDHQDPKVYDLVEVVKVDHSKEVVSAYQLDRMTKNMQHLELNCTKITGSCTTVPRKLKYFKSRQSSVPFSLRELLPKVPNLTILVLDLGTHATSDLESIQSMPSLRKLKLENSASLVRIGPKVDRLTTIIIEHCPKFKSINSVNSAAVEQVEIVNCPDFDFSCVSKLECLVKLALAGFELNSDGSEFTRFPETLVIPPGVEVVDISRNRYLSVMPTFAPDNKIKKLNLRSCPSLRLLTWNMIHTPSLECLDVGGCADLELPSLSEQFRQLKLLDVNGCPKIDHSEFRQSVKEMKDRNPEFRLIGLRLEDKDDEPEGCSALRCFKFSYRKTRTLITKVTRRSSTFPLGKPEFHALSLRPQEEDAAGGSAGLKQRLKSPYMKTRSLIEKGILVD